MHLHFLHSVLTSLPYPPPVRVTSPSNCWVSRCYSRNAGEQFCWYSPFSRSEVLPLLATSDYLWCQSGQMSTVITSHPPSLPASSCSTTLFLSVQLFDIAKYQNWGFLSTSKLSCCMEEKSAFHFPPTTSTNSKILQDELSPKDVLESYPGKSWTWNELLEIWAYQTA